MAEPVKVNAYYGICEFAVGKNIWHVLSDKSVLILAKDEHVFCMDKDRCLYSILQGKDSSYTTLSGAELSLLFIRNNEVTIIRQGEKDDNNKKNVTKI